MSLSQEIKERLSLIRPKIFAVTARPDFSFIKALTEIETQKPPEGHCQPFSAKPTCFVGYLARRFHGVPDPETSSQDKG